MTPIPLSPFITTNNLHLESACPQADAPTVAVESPTPAAAVTHSSSLEVATTAPGMAHSNSVSCGEAGDSVRTSNQPTVESRLSPPGPQESFPDPLEIPAFLKRNADNSFPSDK